ncbi:MULTISPECIES: ABC transporter ATP-binding protein [Actinomycetes]|uniref:ABC transporter ATP-binding protein n=1 Tax=Actinomycetes TaxID=1760 RepID=UPI002AC6C76E|nr:dipeptide/oligopeptide/nickel ABC transporter ATP-binding protein [Nesterenkonia sp. HG001]MDZ5079195.1 dipeptide/oligopeptide/nickel ABC transporter ATP-binding protein [Nesterenkonia sp. HG001]
MTTLLAVDDAHITYRHGRETIQAVRGVTFNVPEGRACGIVGESGSGKSSLARAITGLVPLSKGRIAVRGMAPVTRSGPGGVRMIFQDPIGSLNPRRRLIDIVAEPLRIAGTSTSVARKIAARMLQEVGLDPATFGTRRPGDISGGQAQRIAIARALVAEPTVLVADEPVSGLDVSIQAGIINLLHALTTRQGTALVLISHDLSVVQTLCDHVVVLNNGLVQEQGNIREVFTNRNNAYTRQLISAAPDF